MLALRESDLTYWKGLIQLDYELLSENRLIQVASDETCITY